jgi:hypothetical protein
VREQLRTLENNLDETFPKLLPDDQDRLLSAIFDSEFKILFPGIGGFAGLKELLEIRMPAFPVIMSSTLLKGSEKLLEWLFFRESIDFSEKRQILRYWTTQFSTSDSFVRCLCSFQAIFAAESLMFLDDFTAYLELRKAKNEKFSNETLQIFLRYWLITDSFKMSETLRYILDKSLLETLTVRRKNPSVTDLSYFEIRAIIHKFQQLRIHVNLSWLYDMKKVLKIQNIKDYYFIFLYSRLIFLHEYIHLPAYFEYIRMFYPERVEELLETFRNRLSEFRDLGINFLNQVVTLK